MSCEEHEVVRLRSAVQDCPVAVGAVGAIVFVYEPGVAYEVEFCDAHGVTLALLALREEVLDKVTL